ncbi:MAG: phosphate transport system protein [Bacteroidia bacterium]|jgi:phosphate uptake regulator
MFNWLKRIQESADSATEILGLFEEMLDDGRHIFDAAANCLLAGTATSVVKEDIWSTDIRINKNERKIRRRVLTHASLHGRAPIANDLVLMSLVKDAERIGDYGKNVFDLAAIGRPVVDDKHKELLEMKEQVSRMLMRAKNIYRVEDEEAAREFIKEAGEFGKLCDLRTGEMVNRTEGDGAVAATALTYRYFKRIVSHSMNIITSVVMPFDKTDFFDEK